MSIFLTVLSRICIVLPLPWAEGASGITRSLILCTWMSAGSVVGKALQSGVIRRPFDDATVASAGPPCVLPENP